MKYHYFLLIATSFILNACGSAPSCSDETVKTLVTQIADQKIGIQLGAQLSGELANQGINVDLTKIGWNVDAIRTVDESNNKLVSCAAKVQITYDAKAYFEHDVKYTVQPTDDGKSVYVEASF